MYMESTADSKMGVYDTSLGKASYGWNIALPCTDVICDRASHYIVNQTSNNRKRDSGFEYSLEGTSVHFKFNIKVGYE